MNERDLHNFPHALEVRVRFNEVDMLGVCNNAVYINFFEEGRVQYLKKAGILPENKLFTSGDLLFMVRNEINYRSHSFYDDELTIYTKIAYIKKSSFGFEHIIINKKTNELIADGTGVLVQVDKETRKSKPLSEAFINKIEKYQGAVEQKE